MHTKKLHFTAKYPFQYIVIFDDGISAMTTDEERHKKLLSALTTTTAYQTTSEGEICKFYDLPRDAQMKIENAFIVVKPRIT